MLRENTTHGEDSIVLAALQRELVVLSSLYIHTYIYIYIYIYMYNYMSVLFVIMYIFCMLTSPLLFLFLLSIFAALLCKIIKKNIVSFCLISTAVFFFLFLLFGCHPSLPSSSPPPPPPCSFSILPRQDSGYNHNAFTKPLATRYPVLRLVRPYARLPCLPHQPDGMFEAKLYKNQNI